MTQVKKEHIDKSIYKLSPNIKKQYQILTGGFICSAIGIICTIIYLLFTNYMQSHPALNETLIVFIIIGLLGLISTICFYWIGDCHHPLYTPTGELLSREEMFYDREHESAILAALEKGDILSVSDMPKSVQAQIVVIKYTNADNSFIAAQAFHNDGFVLTPISSISKIEK